jgi:hypothetical protein
MDPLVAVIEPQENRAWGAGVVGDVKQQVDERGIGRFEEADADFFAGRQTVERSRVDRPYVEGERSLQVGNDAINLFGEGLEDLGASDVTPGRGIVHRLAVEGHQRVGERVGDDLRFVVIRIGRLLGREGRAEDQYPGQA